MFKKIYKKFSLTLIVLLGLFPLIGYAEDNKTIKVGVLHSQSGTMAISESTLKDTVLMMVKDLNERGGLLGKKVEVVVMDPKSDWPTYGTMMEKLLVDDKVDVVFGCWTSISRKVVLPVLEKNNGLLFYPVQYEGQEESPNIFYTGATPNQQAIPAVEYLMSPEGGETKRFYLVATDYIYPRTTNAILQSFLKSKNIKEEDIKIVYTDFGNQDWTKIISDIKEFASHGKKTAVISTINGDANIYFYKELAKQNITSNEVPVIAFSVGEGELVGVDVGDLVGHLTAWNYFMSIDTAENQKFIRDFQSFTNDKLRITNDPMEATYIGFKMWEKAVNKAKTTEVEAVKKALSGMEIQGLTGYSIMMDKINHHLHKPVYIGEIQADGQMQIIWKSDGLLLPKNWSSFAPQELQREKNKND